MALSLYMVMDLHHRTISSSRTKKKSYFQLDCLAK
jgi:hypothetical protein